MDQKICLPELLTDSTMQVVTYLFETKEETRECLKNVEDKFVTVSERNFNDMAELYQICELAMGQDDLEYVSMRGMADRKLEEIDKAINTLKQYTEQYEHMRKVWKVMRKLSHSLDNAQRCMQNQQTCTSSNNTPIDQ